jgi:7-cyano-7-deazaguanine synthase in queuosine biosynthesis
MLTIVLWVLTLLVHLLAVRYERRHTRAVEENTWTRVRLDNEQRAVDAQLFAATSELHAALVEAGLAVPPEDPGALAVGKA